jgi:hypothetical protein
MPFFSLNKFWWKKYMLKWGFQASFLFNMLNSSFAPPRSKPLCGLVVKVLTLLDDHAIMVFKLVVVHMYHMCVRNCVYVHINIHMNILIKYTNDTWLQQWWTYGYDHKIPHDQVSSELFFSFLTRSLGPKKKTFRSSNSNYKHNYEIP